MEERENRILVVGGAGYIGGAITDLLKELGMDFLVYDNLMYERDYRKKVPFIFGDIRDTKKLSNILSFYKPTAIIWLAAIVGDGACQTNPELTTSVNQYPVGWLADNFDGKIIFTSTCSVYGKNDELLDEESPTNPLSLYAITKLKAEEYLYDKNAIIFRLGTLYGVSDDFSRIRLDLVVNILSLKATRGEVLTVFGGEQWRPLLHVKDAAKAIVQASTDNGLVNVPNGIYNLASENLCIKNVAEKIKNSSDVPVEINYSEMKFEDKRNYRVKTDKYKNTPGQVSFDKTVFDGAKEIMALIKDGRIKDPLNKIYNNEKFLEGKK